MSSRPQWPGAVAIPQDHRNSVQRKQLQPEPQKSEAQMRTLQEIKNDLTGIDDEVIQRYSDYFENIRPATPDDTFRRFLFAFLSIQTAWELNVRLYRRFKELNWIETDVESVRQVFIEERAGLNELRPVRLWQLGQVYKERPPVFDRHPMESWQAYRDRLRRTLPGLGLAKLAFVIETITPEADCVCLDRHMISKLFGLKSNCVERRYRLLESRFCRLCGDRPPGLVRLAFWDKLQGHSSPDYWAGCLT